MQTLPQRMNPTELPNSRKLGYSQISIVDAGSLAFVSGQVAMSQDGSGPPKALKAQTEQVIANLAGALGALEAKPQNIVLIRIYVTELNDDAMAIIMPPIMSFLDGAEPSLTGIGVAALAGPDLKIEIEMTVQLPA